MHEAQPLEIPLGDLVIRGLQSIESAQSNPKVLCLHGWLDNANSFYSMFPWMPQLDCVAIDLPGHGKSDHFQHTVPYTIAGTAHYVLQVADALGWDEFHLIGHSLGGCIAPICALAEPKRVKSLMLIDALGPIAEPASALPERLQRFHQEMKVRQQTPSRVFKSIDQAVDSRLKATTMARASARLIVERQLTETTADNFQWSFDSKLRAASPSYFTEEQVRGILSSIDCPTLCVVAADGYLTHSQYVHERRRCIDSLTWVELPGNHHLHIDTPQPVAEVINAFIEEQEQ